MIAKSNIKPVDNKGVQSFTLKETVKCPLIVKDPRHDGKSTTFLENGKVQGQVVNAQVAKRDKDGIYKQVINATAVGIIEDNGYYLIPIDKLTWNSDTWNNPTTTEVGFDGNQTVNENLAEVQEIATETLKSDKTYFGFTAKQLVVIAGIVFIVSKLSK